MTNGKNAAAEEAATASQKLYEFRKQIAALKEFRGRGTELISVYITPGYAISDIAGKLRDEQGQASNIKSKSTRTNVVNALEKILQYLKTFKTAPDNGIAIFCGNVSKVEGKTDVQLYSIVPPQPLHVQFYRCESTFVLEPLDEMLETSGSYGLVVVDGSDAAVGILRGKNLKVFKEIHNLAPSKVHKGGQCVQADTLVLLDDNTFAKISELRPEQKILAVDFSDYKVKTAVCTNIFKRNTKNAIRIEVEDLRSGLVATPEHKFFVMTENGIEEKEAEKLKIGDLLLLAAVAPILATPEIASGLYSGNQKILKQIEEVQKLASGKELQNKKGLEALDSLEKFAEGDLNVVKINYIKQIRINDEFFYDLSVPGFENFVANGLIVHNSAARYGRIREEAYEDYFKRIGEAMNSFLEQKNFKGVIVGGPGPVKEKFLKEKTFNYQLKILGVVDTGYSGEYGLKEVLEKAQEFIFEQEAVRERQLVIDFIKRVTSGGLAVYGYENTKRVLESKQAERLLLSEGMQLKQSVFECGKCGKRVEKETEFLKEENCECGGKRRLVSEKDIGEELVGIAESQGIPVEFISRETSEGSQFYGTFKGIAALLRYK